MSFENGAENKKELSSEIVVNPPVVESFLGSKNIETEWPEDIAKNESFLEQINERRKLKKRLDDLINLIPRLDMSFEDGIREGCINQDQIMKVYDSLGKLLKSEDYRRIVLYIPFEFLMDSAGNDFNEELTKSAEDFKESYMEALRRLLFVQDVRANFVDGDVIETEQRESDLPRVVKAAHLIPILIGKGMLSFDEVLVIMEESDDGILKHSIADTFPVLADLGIISEEEIELMKKSKEQLVRGMANIIISNSRKEKTKGRVREMKFASIQEKLKSKLFDLESQEYGDVTKKREEWLRGSGKQKIIESLGKEIGLAIEEGKFSQKEIKNPELDVDMQQVLIIAIRDLIERTSKNDSENGKKLFSQYREILYNFWKLDREETKEELSKTFRRLFSIGIINKEELEATGVNFPKLDGSSLENLELMQEEVAEIKKIIASIEKNPEIAKFIYPLVLIYGSKLKGYGDSNSDIDLGIFIKPGVSFDEKKKLRELIKKYFSQEKIGGEVIEFWLKENGEKLEIIDFPESDDHLGESYWAYMLFGAVWEGNQNIQADLKRKLLSQYMYDTKKVIHGLEARRLYIEEMERNTLQYRLMHKGYERFFPEFGGIHTEHASEIDGDSMFWDSGYRQLAIKLFVSKVFLPKIEKD